MTLSKYFYYKGLRQAQTDRWF